MGHYDSACPDLLAFKNSRTKSKKTSVGSEDDGAGFTNLRIVKAKEVILCSLQTKSKNKDNYVKLEPPVWKSNFLIQLDGGAQVSIIKKKSCLACHSKISDKGNTVTIKCR